MAKAEKPSAKPKKESDKDQAERFKETARQLGVDETGGPFSEAFGKIVPPKSRSPAKT